LNVTVIGLGYVGLTNALEFDQQLNWNVRGIDIDENKIQALREGNIFIHEPGLAELASNHRIELSSSYNNEIRDFTDIIVVCVGTPFVEGEVKLDYVWDAMRSIGIRLSEIELKRRVIILKSTVPPGTSQKCIEILEDMSGLVHGEDFGFVMSPEFLQEGSALTNIHHPDKIVIGHKFKWEAERVEGFMKTPLAVFPPIIKTSYVNAEFIKYANNAFLATKISFINEMATLCELIPGADVKVLAEAIGHDDRISERFLRAGLGYGGSCFSKDIDTIVKWGQTRGHDATFLSEVQAVNGSQRDWPVQIILNTFSQSDEEAPLKSLRVAMLGATFKPNTNDMRDAPSADIIDQLDHLGARVILYDPTIQDNADLKTATSAWYSVIVRDNIIKTLDGAHCAVLVTEWPEFGALTPDTFNKYLINPIVIDGRRMYDPEDMKRKGIKYYGVGYGTSRGAVS
jgi:UDPglucose 6-dehydrogenase